ncbi:MAG TPA: prolyl oligopeptidase family serine peptidase [Usitatibacter sp.]|nr:prolyl oligopeptidase family serine peptidase [Usitatibacter sp.]
MGTSTLPSRAAELLEPPVNLVIEGAPAVPAELAAKLEPYGDFRAHQMLSWHPQRRELLVSRRIVATNQVHRVSDPGANPEPLTDGSDAVDVARFDPADGESFLFLRAHGGSEAYRLFREEVSTKSVAALSPEAERVSDFDWAPHGGLAVYATQPLDRHNPANQAVTTVHVVDPAHPESDRVIAKLPGGGWSDFRFSEDGRHLCMTEWISIVQSSLWVMDVATGRKRRVTPRSREQVSYGPARFSKDGKALITTSDRGSEFHRLVYLPLAGGKPRVLTPKLAFDVEDFDISFDAKRIAFVTNEDGASALRFMDLATFKELPRPPLLRGVLHGLRWRPHSTEVGFTLVSARSAGDVFTYDLDSNQTTRWTNGRSPAVDSSSFAEPRVVKWKSFDGLEVSGLLYSPPKSFEGKRPVIVYIHGGPESQSRPGFLGRLNYFVSELGVAMVFPNVRGSSGFGKSYVKLDDTWNREHSVKDIGALLDWIAAQPELDASRIMVYGGSYGGYMTLASAVHFSGRIKSAVDIVGISNFVTFLEHTETYRRDLRRVEYGDERDPEMRAFLESISPLTHAERITVPMLVASGLNDPRVPYTEGEQIVANLKQRGTPVWYVLAKDEGHGFARKPNADYLFCLAVQFAKATLLE